MYKTKNFILLLFVVIIFHSCQNKQEFNIVGKWQLFGIDLNDSKSEIENIIALKLLGEYMPLYYDFNDSIVTILDSTGNVLDKAYYKYSLSQNNITIYSSKDTNCSTFRYSHNDSLEMFLEPYIFKFIRVIPQ